MIKNLIKYYTKITDLALTNLADLKTFQFRKMLMNNSQIRVAESTFEKHTRSNEARNIIKEYNKKMSQMYVYAKEDYNKTLKKVKAAKEAKNDVLLQKLLNDYANKGITGFVAKNGAKWNIETYSNMLTVHTNNTLVRLAETEKIKAKGKNLVRISDHDTICELCIPYEGKILTFAELEEAKKKGLYHPNCKHYHMEV
jgi:hypothetical protein